VPRVDHTPLYRESARSGDMDRAAAGGPACPRAAAPSAPPRAAGAAPSILSQIGPIGPKCLRHFRQFSAAHLHTNLAVVAVVFSQNDPVPGGPYQVLRERLAEGVLARAQLPAAGTRRFGRLSALRAHAKSPYEADLLWETRRALNRPGRARTE
jgi:hypothetical protein